MAAEDWPACSYAEAMFEKKRAWRWVGPVALPSTRVETSHARVPPSDATSTPLDSPQELTSRRG